MIQISIIMHKYINIFYSSLSCSALEDLLAVLYSIMIVSIIIGFCWIFSQIWTFLQLHDEKKTFILISNHREIWFCHFIIGCCCHCFYLKYLRLVPIFHCKMTSSNSLFGIICCYLLSLFPFNFCNIQYHLIYIYYYIFFCFNICQLNGVEWTSFFFKCHKKT